MLVLQLGEGGAIDLLSRMLLILMRLVLFALALGLTVISYQAYSAQRTKRLESAFIGFAFISMGTALSMMNSRAASSIGGSSDGILYLLQLAEMLPFIIGFAMLYVSLYR